MLWIGVNKVTRLALEARNSDFHDDFGFFTTEEINLDRLVRFMSKFPKLKWLFLIVLPLPDDMETVVVQETDNGNKEKREGEGDEDANTVCGNGGNDIGGDWIRGENGISDWYRWVPPSTSWLKRKSGGALLRHGEMEGGPPSS